MPATRGLPRQYEYTEIEDDQIRLLLLDRQSKDGDGSKLTGQLLTYTLTIPPPDPGEGATNEACQYEALSYTWDDPIDEMGIYSDNF